ncbi:hypothetical protein G6F56_005369 [Rhizopus delemar]|nr:hypothetical protein G6F56_005369 [Rhizopus delemar]
MTSYLYNLYTGRYTDDTCRPYNDRYGTDYYQNTYYRPYNEHYEQIYRNYNAQETQNNFQNPKINTFTRNMSKRREIQSRNIRSGLFQMFNNALKTFQNKGALNNSSVQVVAVKNDTQPRSILNSEQQGKLWNQLKGALSNHSPVVMSPEKVEITRLDRIWVFRLVEQDPQPRTGIIWTGFDYKNQMVIERHIRRPVYDRLVFYDSHMPQSVTIIPNKKVGYFFSEPHQTRPCSLEVVFINNYGDNILFVYRV